MVISERLYELVERFDLNLEAYRSRKYNEAQVRVDFINPFLALLGWDVDNKQGRPEAYRDVIYEDRVKVGGGTKAPDYGFYAGGARRFFLEAKKPSVDLQNDVSPAVQLRRYAWSAKLPLSILTDFEEFAVYDCRVEPEKNDKPTNARLDFLTYDEYPDRWDDIYSVFSREAVLSGSFDKYAESTKRKRGAETVNSAFLREIESWREVLARNIALLNNLSIRQLNYAVQMTIDRIIFLRMAEDRGVEDYGRLLALINGNGVYERLCHLFRDADDRYNSGLFHFRRERGRDEEPDEFTTSLKIDDTVLKGIIRSLYYPESPYEFSVLPLDVLGQVYEQFLGKVIRLEDGIRAIVEEKPEVRKAGGVYYTPTYIVDYIVKNTVGNLLEGKRPGPRGGVSRLKIVDPACGSGSFLIGAYEYLLDWHRDRYLEDGSEKHLKEIYQGPGGQWHLTIDEKRRILLNNIYGVDIDPQAVEVTKLSLLLKVLEGESSDSITRQLALIQERALPDLDNNIKCGNSLIGPDFYDNEQMSFLDEEEHYRINVFDWRESFPQVFKGDSLGFDAVIGNPPYVGFHGFKREKEYLKHVFSSAKGKFDLYLPFIEKGLDILGDKGLLSYICPTNFTKREHGKSLRDYLARNTKIIEIVDFKDVQIFKGALNYTGVFTFQKAKPAEAHTLIYKQKSLDDNEMSLKQSTLSDMLWVFRSDEATEIVRKIEGSHVSQLGHMSTGISEGIVTGHNSVFLMTRQDAAQLGLEEELMRPCIRGRQIRRYWMDTVEEVVLYPHFMSDGRTVGMSEAHLERFPNAWDYLRSRRDDLRGRSYFEASSKAWYELWCQRDLKQLNMEKIVVPELAASNRFTLAHKDYYGDTVCGITLKDQVEESLKYVLGLLNSQLIEFYYKQTTVPKANGFYIYKTMFLKEIPIRRIDASDPIEKAAHDKIVKLVEQMLALQEQLKSSKIEYERTVREHRIEAVDKQIDHLVYGLYKLTTEEVRAVEDALR